MPGRAALELVRLDAAEESKLKRWLERVRVVETNDEAVDAIIECIIGNLTRGERVQIPGFGTFNISERAAREGRNPATGEAMHIPASKSVRFKPGKALKDAVN